LRGKKIIAFFILIAVLLMPVAVFADVPIPDTPPGAYSYWAVVLRLDNSVYLITSPNPITASDQGKYGIKLSTRSGDKTYNLIDGNWSYDKEELGYISKTWPIEHVYAANHDIAWGNGSGFFFTLPKVSELCQIVRQVKDRGTFGMMWQTILAGLIPLVGCLILGISFRKGWEFLRRQLTH
jgi:hypothetical protein